MCQVAFCLIAHHHDLVEYLARLQSDAVGFKPLHIHQHRGIVGGFKHETCGRRRNELKLTSGIGECASDGVAVLVIECDFDAADGLLISISHCDGPCACMHMWRKATSETTQYKFSYGYGIYLDKIINKLYSIKSCFLDFGQRGSGE